MSSDPLLNAASGERILRMRELSQRLQLSPSRLYALIAEGKFLPPFQLVPGGRAVGWLECEVDAWLRARRSGDDRAQSRMLEAKNAR
jgi:prophage regulatory protein